MTQPTEELIVWANTDVNLPKLAGPNKTKPIDDLINKGWDFTEKPAADEFNYILNNLGMHISYLEQNKTYTVSGDVTGTATSTGSEDVTFNVSVTDNSHNHISANISDATSANNSNTVVKRGASGEISVGDLTISKVGDVSTINFPAAETDTGYIKHSETNDASRMQFCISDNNDSNDKFEFGNTEGGSFVPRFTIDANGTTNVKSSVTATNFIGPLQGNALTATTLQNSRTINGTSFNGSTNITTHRWGYSCNLAFTGFATGNGNVDGSGNVSIELSMGSGFTSSKTTNGYTYLPNGVILQWGYTNGGVTFPVTFPSACLNVSLTSNNTDTGGYDYKIAASNLTTTGFSITRDSDDTGSYVYWFAIGY